MQDTISGTHMTALGLGEQKEVSVVPVEPQPKKTVPPLEASYQHPAMKYGLPSPVSGSQHLRVFDSFVAAFDSRTRNPSWVMEHLAWYERPAEDVDRTKSMFVEDEAIDVRFRTKSKDFENSGYDRGHMAPAANHKRSQKAMDDTFTLTNISPQVGAGFNRDYWARFEKFVRNLVKISTAVYVATGPLWLPEKEGEGKYIMKYPMIGKPPALISVPTHFYKVVLAEPKDLDSSNGSNGNDNHVNGTNGFENKPTDCAVAAFVMPNRAIPSNVPLTRFAVPISELEGATGLTFFPKYMTMERRERLDRAALVWRSIGRTMHGVTNVPLQSLDGVEPDAKKKTIAEREAAKLKIKDPQPIMKKKCSLEPHLCYHTECSLPPPEFWKKTGSSGSIDAKSDSRNDAS